VKRNYGSSRHGRDGLGFDVQLNDKLYAASGGKVVYVGNHHKQLGGLVVIHHANDIVSAYAFCGKMVVKLGQQVAVGDHIAHVGYNPNGQPAFNFGIRKDGKSLDVLAYLPKRK
jgi:lipoprotein NlpD